MNYPARLERLRALLSSLPCDALLIEHPIDLLYLTGLELSSGKLIVTQQDACLIVDGRYYERCRNQSLYPTLLLKDHLLRDWILDSDIHHLGFDQENTSYQGFSKLTELMGEEKTSTHWLKIIPLESPVQKLRLIKDADEMQALRKAAQLGYEGYELIVSLLREGVIESELAFELEFFWKKQGGSRLAFDPTIAFGTNSSMPHYRAGSSKLTLNSPVLIDIGVVLNHYHSDMTRVVFFGTPSPILKTIYSIVDEAKN